MANDHIRLEPPKLGKLCSVYAVDGDHCSGDVAAIVVAVGAANTTTSISLCEYHRQELRYKIGMYSLRKRKPKGGE